MDDYLWSEFCDFLNLDFCSFNVLYYLRNESASSQKEIKQDLSEILGIIEFAERLIGKAPVKRSLSFLLKYDMFAGSIR